MLQIAKDSGEIQVPLQVKLTVELEKRKPENYGNLSQ